MRWLLLLFQWIIYQWMFMNRVLVPRTKYGRFFYWLKVTLKFFHVNKYPPLSGLILGDLFLSQNSLSRITLHTEYRYCLVIKWIQICKSQCTIFQGVCTIWTQKLKYWKFLSVFVSRALNSLKKDNYSRNFRWSQVMFPVACWKQRRLDPASSKPNVRQKSENIIHRWLLNEGGGHCGTLTIFVNSIKLFVQQVLPVVDKLNTKFMLIFSKQEIDN